MLLERAGIGVFGTQSTRQAKPQRRPGLRPQGHQRVEKRRVARARYFGRTPPEQRSGPRHIENLVADRNADAKLRVLCPCRAIHAIGQVLDREIAVWSIGAFDKAAAGWIVGLVEGLCHMMVLPAFCYDCDMDSQSLTHWPIVPDGIVAWRIVP